MWFEFLSITAPDQHDGFDYELMLTPIPVNGLAAFLISDLGDLDFLVLELEISSKDFDDMFCDIKPDAYTGLREVILLIKCDAGKDPDTHLGDGEHWTRCEIIRPLNRDDFAKLSEDK